MPAYVVAYVYAGLLDVAGPVHEALRHWLGASGPLSWFPQIRSLPGAIAVLVLVLYPYVYMLARAAFLEQSVCVLEVSRTLGLNSWGSAFHVAMPLARPSIAIGAALALMEALNDFGAVQHFGVDTFTTGIYRVWLARGDITAAAQLALILVAFTGALLWIERASRGRAGYMHMTTRYRPLPTYPLRRGAAAGAILVCSLPVALGFVVPVAALAVWAIGLLSSLDTHYLRLAINSVTLAGAAALLCVVIGAALAYAQRSSRGNRAIVRTAALAGLGYAVPGAVIAVGAVLVLATFDRVVAATAVFSGGVFALLYAYVVRFLPIAMGALESGLTRITGHMDDAARTLGRGPVATLATVHAPMMQGSLLTAALLVFVDVMKELPATLMIRPFGFDTLAIRTYEYASDEQLAAAAPAALAIVAAGIIPVLLLSGAISRSRPGRRRVAAPPPLAHA
jgi:iron(III) transport system permease protein